MSSTMEDECRNDKDTMTSAPCTYDCRLESVNFSVQNAADNLSTNSERRYRVKSAVIKRLHHLEAKMKRQLLYSLCRTLLCYLCLICLIVVIAYISEPNHGILDGEGIAIIICFCLGATGIPFQIYHIFGDFGQRTERTSLLRRFLDNKMDKSQFLEIAAEKISSPPSFGVELQLRSGAVVLSDDPQHWSRTTRKIEQHFSYDLWTDESENATHFIDSSGAEAVWFFMEKSFFWGDAQTKASLDEDIKSFKSETYYEKHKYYMSLEYLLDLEEVNFFPDVDTFLVTSSNSLWTLQLYRIFLLMCIDFIYHIIFRIKVKRARNYSLIKVMYRTPK